MSSKKRFNEDIFLNDTNTFEQNDSSTARFLAKINAKITNNLNKSLNEG